MEPFERGATNLETSLPAEGPQKQADKQKQDKNQNKMPPMSHTLMDLIITIALYLPRDSYRSLFRMAEIMINKDKDPQLQKKAYKFIPRLAESEMGKATLKDRTTASTAKRRKSDSTIAERQTLRNLGSHRVSSTK
jgi:ribosomal RNA-processing protein 12